MKKNCNSRTGPSYFENGRHHDWHFQDEGIGHRFSAGSIHIGDIHKDAHHNYTAVPAKYPCPLKLEGFRTRFAAASFLIQWRTFCVNGGKL